MKEVNDNPCQYDENTNDNDPFPCSAVHDAKIGLINEAVRVGTD